MAFKDIFGNPGVKKILSKALKHKKLPNSLLFSGPDGIGKKQTALVVAKALNCLKKTSDACEECANCKAINNGNFPDVMILSPVKDVLKIEQMRLLKDTAYLKPMTARKRIFIVEKAEQMSDEASNSLLKILEEPPSFSQIILLTANPYRIMATIKSRCRIFQFLPIPREEIQKALEGRGCQAEKAKVLSLLVRGNLELALALEWDEVQEQRKEAWKFFLALLKKDRTSLYLQRFSGSRAAVQEDLENVLGMLSSFCRDVILLREGGDEEFLLNPDYAEGLRQLKLSVTTEKLTELLSRTDFAMAGLKKNCNVNILTASMFSNFMEWDHV
jgi:DNA polymerase III delta' subunit